MTKLEEQASVLSRKTPIHNKLTVTRLHFVTNNGIHNKMHDTKAYIVKHTN